ncbi:UNVERIFIED_CONTAM: Kirola [Sesamum calycinum]|uniref:Kirola n=1 Tax=Sesamum calycinum TaxID=2727403 RepID=A0AAW2MNS6_9LAMI
MANLTADSVVASAAIKSPADKFFTFFRYNMNEIINIFPEAFTGVELLEGEEGTVGCVKRWSYILGGIPMTATEKTEAIDEGAKSLTTAVVEGDLLLLYKSFQGILTVSEGLAEWTLVFEKATPDTPPPEDYVPLANTLCTLVDAFLLLN